MGGRPNDFEVPHADFHGRGRTFENQLRELNELWSGDVVGPDPANGKRPTLLIEVAPMWRSAARPNTRTGGRWAAAPRIS